MSGVRQLPVLCGDVCLLCGGQDHLNNILPPQLSDHKMQILTSPALPIPEVQIGPSCSNVLYSMVVSYGSHILMGGG